MMWMSCFSKVLKLAMLQESWCYCSSANRVRRDNLLTIQEISILEITNVGRGGVAHSLEI